MTGDHHRFDHQRMEKRARLLAEGVNPYPYAFSRTHTLGEIIRAVRERESADCALDFSVRISGRIWARRKMGRVCFLDLRDDSDRIQLYFTRPDFTDQEWGHLALLDLGDIIGVEGKVFRTRTGELSVNVDDFTILAKTLVPVPMGKETGDRVHYRIADPESQYRERYLHWLLDQEGRDRIVQRSRIISCLRRHLAEAGFLEVSTPTIDVVYGGAEARPFSTSIWALDHQEAFLRISPELYLKRYIVAGFEKVFNLGANFRNEGIDRSHNPEFLMLEWYEAFTDYQDQMQRFETLVAGVCEEVCGSTRITYQGVELDFSPPWQRLTMLAALDRYANIDAGSMSALQLQAELEQRGVEGPPSLSWGLAVDHLFAATCEEHLVQPTFILDHPRAISPLTKAKRGDERLAERFEPYVCGMELGNAYSELTDPVDQLEQLLAQRQARSNEVNHPLDADFLNALGCGMPPTGGAGLGVDRLIMLLTDAPSIQDAIPFPMVKPLGST